MFWRSRKYTACDSCSLKIRDQHIGTVTLGLHRPVAIPAENRASVGSRGFVIHDQRRGLFQKAVDVTTQPFDIGTTGAQHLGCRRIVQQGQQQMFDRRELVLFLPGALNAWLRVNSSSFAQHLYLLPITAIRPRCSDHPDQRWFPPLSRLSRVHSNGCWLAREWSLTCATLVSAMSWKTPRRPHAARMDVQHDRSGLFPIHSEKYSEYVYDKPIGV